jgi:hypothetical protein
MVSAAVAGVAGWCVGRANRSGHGIWVGRRFGKEGGNGVGGKGRRAKAGRAGRFRRRRRRRGGRVYWMGRADMLMALAMETTIDLMDYSSEEISVRGERVLWKSPRYFSPSFAIYTDRPLFRRCFQCRPLIASIFTWLHLSAHARVSSRSCTHRYRHLARCRRVAKTIRAIPKKASSSGHCHSSLRKAIRIPRC